MGNIASGVEMPEWIAPAIVLNQTPYGEGQALTGVLSAEHGHWKGIARGGSSRAGRIVWQTGNLIACQWKARLEGQLGYFTGEPVTSFASRLLDRPSRLMMLESAASLLSALLPEHEKMPVLFDGTLELFASLSLPDSPWGTYLRWETLLLQETGFGLSLERCAVTGAAENLVYVSPRTGRAVSLEAAGEWKDRLLVLPEGFASGDLGEAPARWREGLLLTGHFLTRALGEMGNRPLPGPRLRLLELLEERIEKEKGED